MIVAVARSCRRTLALAGISYHSAVHAVLVRQTVGSRRAPDLRQKQPLQSPAGEEMQAEL